MNVAFLDRDGTLLWEPPESEQIDSLAKFRVLPGVFEGLSALQRRGYALVVVSNQDGLGTPAFPKDAFEAPQAELLRQLQERGITLSEVFICPHLPEDGCPCRKPRTGLVDDYLKRMPVDAASSLMIGDRESDKQFAENIGVRFVRMETNGRFPRFASLRRKTRETDVSVFLNVDGSGQTEISTGIGFFDHMLNLLARHALVDLTLRAEGDLAVDEHHTVEDVGLALGARWPKPSATSGGGTLRIPAADGRGPGGGGGGPFRPPPAGLQGQVPPRNVGDPPTELVPHFFESFADALRCGLHLSVRRGTNDHHKIEALFKGWAAPVRQAFRLCPHERDIPSTKGSL